MQRASLHGFSPLAFCSWYGHLSSAGAGEAEGVAPITMQPESEGKAVQCSRMASAHGADRRPSGDVHRSSEHGFCPKESWSSKGQCAEAGAGVGERSDGAFESPAADEDGARHCMGLGV
jgi:hypothetical protein